VSSGTEAGAAALRVISTPEFGSLKNILVYGLRKGADEEGPIYSQAFSGSPQEFDIRLPLSLPEGPLRYIRAEAVCRSDRAGETMACTSPWYVNNTPYGQQ